VITLQTEASVAPNPMRFDEMNAKPTEVPRSLLKRRLYNVLERTQFEALRVEVSAICRIIARAIRLVVSLTIVRTVNINSEIHLYRKRIIVISVVIF
jgi:hypothetical protein